MKELRGKSELRSIALSRRDALDPLSRVEMSIAACEFGASLIDVEAGAVISGFLPIRSEIDPRPLLDRFRSRGARLCVPVIIDRTTIEFRELVRGAPLVECGFGTFGPGPEAAVLDPSILIMPLAAFDREGNRLGYGAGYYDRAITRLEEKGIAPIRIGIAFSVQELDHVPTEAHDRKLDAILTETGLRWFGQRSE